MPRTNLRQIDIEIPNKYLMPEIIKLLEEGSTVTIRLKGYSMRPFLEGLRDKALLKKHDNIKINDIVLAEIDKKQYVLHRVINICGNDVTLRGDGNIRSESCKIDDIKGIAIGFYRKGRTKLEFTNDSKWKIYSFLWNKLYPLRKYLLYIYRKLWIRVFPVKL